MTATTTYEAKLRTFGGDALDAVIDIEPDGTLTIVTDDVAGHRSAHLACARNHFDAPVTTELEHKYTDSTGRKRVMTCWYSRRA